MWTKTTREQYRREGLGYAGDTTDAQWAMVEPLMPAVKRTGAGSKAGWAAPQSGSDTNGLLVGAQPHGADIQDRDGAVGVLASWSCVIVWQRPGLCVRQRRCTEPTEMPMALAIARRSD
jgi:hypothetical protein